MKFFAFFALLVCAVMALASAGVAPQLPDVANPEAPRIVRSPGYYHKKEEHHHHYGGGYGYGYHG